MDWMVVSWWDRPLAAARPAVPSSKVSPPARVAGSVSRIWAWAVDSRTFCRGVLFLSLMATT